MSLRGAWRVCGWCTRQGCRLSLWIVWLLLLAALAGQIHLLSARRVPVPEPLRRLIGERLAEQGVHFDYGRGRMNLAGRFLLEDVRVGPVDTRDPLATARSVYLQFNPWDLLVGQLRLQEVRVSGLDLHLSPDPAVPANDASPARNIDFGVRIQDRELELSYFTGYIDRLPVQASGRFPLSAPRDGRTRTPAQLLKAGSTVATSLRDAAKWIAPVEVPRLVARLAPDAVALELHAEAVDLQALPLPHPPEAKLGRIRVNTSVPVGTSTTNQFALTGTIDFAALPKAITARDLRFHLQGVFGDAAPFDPRQLDLQLASLRWRDVETGALVATVTQPAPGRYHADISLTAAGSAWRLQGSADPLARSGRVALDGFIGDATLAFAGDRIGRDLTALLDPADPAPVHASAAFGPGWKLSRASGRLHSGPVRVGGAQLDETGTEFTYDGTHVVADNLVLRQGPSLAHGSYEMDTRTRDFRFLLTGGLRPEGIESWFHAWWSNFWSTFDFSRALPVADVDVRGRWGDLTATRVFVQAEGAGTGLKGVEFDRVRTRLFLRPHWFDILHFDVLQKDHTAAGRLARSLDLEKNTWRHMDFDVASTLPLETISALFKDEAAKLVAPYRFTTPPTLRLVGRVDSDASPSGKKEHIDVSLGSTGPMTYHGFPLSDLNVEALLRDESIELPSIAVGFAQGKATGTARLQGPETARRLAFNITLADAHLGTVIEAVARLQPAAAPAEGKAADAARERQQRLERGRLVFSLAAEGLYADFHSFKGSGRAAITGAELAQLNLFGPLSEALRGTAFSFGSFSLTTVDAPFVLDGNTVRFDDLRVTGPSALIQAKGDYLLRESRLDFTTKIHPFDESGSLVGNAMGFMLSPLSKMFEVKLQGTLSKPTWIFAYGPSRFFNVVTGNPAQTPAPAAPPPAPRPDRHPAEPGSAPIPAPDAPVVLP